MMRVTTCSQMSTNCVRTRFNDRSPVRPPLGIRLARDERFALALPLGSTPHQERLGQCRFGIFQVFLQSAAVGPSHGQLLRFRVRCAYSIEGASVDRSSSIIP